MKAILPILAVVSAGGLAWHGLAPEPVREPAPAREPLAQLPPGTVLPETPGIVLEPPPARLQPANPAYKFDPTVHALTADVPLTCRVLRNGAVISATTFTKVPNIADTPNGRYWILGSGVEFWAGTVNVGTSGNRSVHLVHATFQPDKSVPALTWTVTPATGGFPNHAVAYYSSWPVSNSPISVTCDVSYEWSQFVGGGTVVFAFSEN